MSTYRLGPTLPMAGKRSAWAGAHTGRLAYSPTKKAEIYSPMNNQGGLVLRLRLIR